LIKHWLSALKICVTVSMVLKRKLLRKSKVYLILDAQVFRHNVLFEIVKKTVGLGVDIYQLRDKNSTPAEIIKISGRILKLIRKRALYIINDRVDLAMAARADGVHLGREDMPVQLARKLAGNKMLIGASCQSLRHIDIAQRQGADYVGFGSVFKTLTKPKRDAMDLRLLKSAGKKCRIPLFAIGGIGLNNLSEVKNCGISRVAVCRSICKCENVGETLNEFNKILK